MVLGRQTTSDQWRWGAAIGVLMLTALVLLLRPEVMHWFGLDEDEVDVLRLAAYSGDVGALEWIAQDVGFYAQNNLQVELLGYASGKAAIEALQEGHADIATASDFVLASSSFDDPTLRVLASICYYRNKGIVGRRDRGIEVVRDLQGKRIGLTSPSGAEYTLYLYLALNGLANGDVTTVHLSPQEIIDAMQQGSIDAAITWQPHVQRLQELLGPQGVTFEGGVFDVYLLLLTQGEALASQGRAMRKLLRALLMAQEWAEQNPQQAKALISKRFGLDPQALELQWQRMRLALTLPQELLTAMDGEARWLAGRSADARRPIPDYARVVAPELLRAVKPSAVTLFTRTESNSNKAVPTAVLH